MQSFNKGALQDKILSMVHFTSEWKVASQIASIIFNDLAKTYSGSAKFYAVKMEDEDNLCKELGVMEVPTILFFWNGELIDHSIGLVSKNILISKIETALSNANRN